MTHQVLLDALHLWLHRAGGDNDLAAACLCFDWSTLPALELTPAERGALETLRDWHAFKRVDLIGASEDFHEALSGCRAVAAAAGALDAAQGLSG